MRQRTLTVVFLVISSLLLTNTVMGQRVSFGLYATDGIVIDASGGSGDLNFNSKENILLPEQSVTINIIGDEPAILMITGWRDREITITVDPPEGLFLDGIKIPLILKFAYSNIGATGEAGALSSFVEVPTGFTTVTIPILRRVLDPPGILPGKPPGAPPTPGHGNYTAPTGTVYLFVYGTLGPVPINAPAGIYTEKISIHVSYAIN